MKQQTISDMQVSGAGAPTLINFIKALWVNPSFEAIYSYRVSARLCDHGKLKRFIARILWRRLLKSCGCDITPQSRIGERVKIVHPQGVTIGAGAVIGDDCTIYQGVTVGLKEEGGKFPVIKENVTIGAGALILGGITIGKNAVIGAGAVVLKDVPEGAIAVGVPASIIPCKTRKRKAA